MEMISDIPYPCVLIIIINKDFLILFAGLWNIYSIRACFLNSVHFVRYVYCSDKLCQFGVVIV